MSFEQDIALKVLVYLVYCTVSCTYYVYSTVVQYSQSA